MTESTFDTNILIYAYDHREKQKQQLAEWIVDRCFAQEGLIALQVLTEFYRAATRKLISTEQARSLVEAYRSGMRVAAAGELDLARAMQLHQRHKLQFFDCLLLATVGRCGCSVLISEDMQDGETYGGVRVVNPFTSRAADLQALLR